MEITKEFLLSEIRNFEQQRDHGHDVAVAAQAAIDAYKALTHRLDTKDTQPMSPTLDVTGPLNSFSGMGLPDPEPVNQ